MQSKFSHAKIGIVLKNKKKKQNKTKPTKIFLNNKKPMKLWQATALATVFIIISGMVTAVIPNPFFTRMIEVTWLDWFFLLATGVLMIPALTLKCDSCVAGSTGGLLAFSCPICNKLLVLWGLAPFLMDYRYYIGALSLIFLIVIIFKSKGINIIKKKTKHGN